MSRDALPTLFAVPLAERMRPVTLDEVLGQDHLLGPGRPLRQLIEADRLTSMLLWGPPGSGKTTIARLLAGHTEAAFEPFSAVLGGVKEVRAIVEHARKRRDSSGERTLLFVDEIHRFNRAQQDAFLPHVESGLVTLVGATTENPSFRVNSALASRCVVQVLRPIPRDDLVALMKRALTDTERGVGTLGLELTDEALVRLVDASGGDARRCLGAIERVALHHRARPMGLPALGPEELAEALDESSLLYDRSGEEHFNCVSAFIKSMRGSDPDAALYYLARMVEAGEDPMFVARRLVIFASEDVGLADPRAVQVAVACKDAIHFLGLPEARYPLAQATLYLATAPKSGSSKGYFTAADAVRRRGALPVPLHLRNAATALMKELDYGKGYRNPHAYEGEFVAEEYLPDELRGQRFYAPSDQGYEKVLAERLEIWGARKERGDRRKKR